MSAQPSKSFSITPYKQKNIDKEAFEELCRIQCTQQEIAAVFRCSPLTIWRWCLVTYGENFEAVYKRFTDDGKACLRRLQVKWAEKNPTMALWLGKQWLGQADKVEVEHSTKSDLEKAQEILDFHRQNSQDFTEQQIYVLLIQPHFPEITAKMLQIKGIEGDEGTEPA